MDILADVSFYTVLVTALIDSINPCAIGVLVFLCSTLLTLAKNPKKMLFAGIMYVTAVYVTYFLAGIGLLVFIQKLNISEQVSVLVGGIVIILGFFEIKDFFWYGKGFSLQIAPKRVEQIKRWAKKATIPVIIGLGFLVAAVELPCTGGPYLAITTFLANQVTVNPAYFSQALIYLLFYNFIFVLPLIVIVLIVYFGRNVEALKAWNEKHKKWMRLATGIIVVALGILLILYARGVISLG
jgi:cytochrome c biogenesis protein CcdA